MLRGVSDDEAHQSVDSALRRAAVLAHHAVKAQQLVGSGGRVDALADGCSYICERRGGVGCAWLMEKMLGCCVLSCDSVALSDLFVVVPAVHPMCASVASSGVLAANKLCRCAVEHVSGDVGCA